MNERNEICGVFCLRMFLVFMCQKRSVISMNHACHVIMYWYIYIHVY